MKVVLPAIDEETRVRSTIGMRTLLARSHKSVQEADMSILKRSGAEFIGTFWLVFGGCGSAVLAAAAVLW